MYFLEINDWNIFLNSKLAIITLSQTAVQHARICYSTTWFIKNGKLCTNFPHRKGLFQNSIELVSTTEAEHTSTIVKNNLGFTSATPQKT